MGELVLEAGHRGRVGVLVELAHVLMGEDVPVVFRADRDAGSRRGVARAALGHRVAELPAVGRDLHFLPLPLVVVPLVPAADLHAGIALAFEGLVLVVGLREVLSYEQVFHRNPPPSVVVRRGRAI